MPRQRASRRGAWQIALLGSGAVRVVGAAYDPERRRILRQEEGVRKVAQGVKLLNIKGITKF